MTSIDDLRPAAKPNVIELVEQAGVDVSDWANFKGGKEKAAVNPKYCYEWAFVEPGKVIVLNLWWENLEERDGLLFQQLNFARDASENAVSAKRSTWVARAKKAEQALNHAWKEGLPVRVILLDGTRRNPEDPDAKASKVTKRSLDPVAWSPTHFDQGSGQWTLVRGVASNDIVDQFEIRAAENAERSEVISQVFKRDPAVRRSVLNRSGGRCELCGEEGFKMAGGRVFLETHHVHPLSEGGSDTTTNVVALCPNHHREAHFGVDSERIRRMLEDVLQSLDSSRDSL